MDGITVDVSSVGGNLNSATGFDGGAAGLALLNDVGLVGTYDGFGIGDDEVSAGLQSLTVDFSPAVNIVSVFLLDLFNGEIATLNVGGDFNGSNVAGGFLDILLNQTLSSITFTANAGGAINNNDFAIAGFEVAAVPLPAALPLLGAGFAALGFVGWRRKRRAV